MASRDLMRAVKAPFPVRLAPFEGPLGDLLRPVMAEGVPFTQPVHSAVRAHLGQHLADAPDDPAAAAAYVWGSAPMVAPVAASLLTQRAVAVYTQLDALTAGRTPEPLTDAQVRALNRVLDYYDHHFQPPRHLAGTAGMPFLRSGPGPSWIAWARSMEGFIRTGRRTHALDLRPTGVDIDDRPEVCEGIEEIVLHREVAAQLLAHTKRLAHTLLRIGRAVAHPDQKPHLDADRLEQTAEAHLRAVCEGMATCEPEEVLAQVARFVEDFEILDEDIPQLVGVHSPRAVARVALADFRREEVATLVGCGVATFDHSAHLGKHDVRAHLTSWPTAPTPHFQALFTPRINRPRAESAKSPRAAQGDRAPKKSVGRHSFRRGGVPTFGLRG